MLVAALAVAALGVAGCGDDGHAHGENSAVPDGARRIDVVGRDFAFEPATIEVAAGEPIELALRVENEEHDFTSDDAGAHIGGEPGETAVGGFTAPDEPGEYEFWCSVGNHRQLGMEGTLVVTAGD